MIFDYSLNPSYLSSVDGNPLDQEDGPSWGCFSAEDDRLFRISKNGLIGSKEFSEIIEEPGWMLSRGKRLGIM